MMFAKTRVVAVSAALLALSSAGTHAADVAPAALVNRTIGYVITSYHWAMFATKEAKECPEGMNDGPRGQYAALFPKDGTVRKVEDTVLRREAAIWFPTAEPDQFKFKEPVTKIAPGLNLDGKIGANDFESPDGEKGIDNQFNRVYGCVADMRPNGILDDFQNKMLQQYQFARMAIELTNVDSLVNDDDVTVTFYKVRDPLSRSAIDNQFLPYSSQRVDERWGKLFVHSMHGKIVSGVLTTEPGEIALPYHYNFSPRQYYRVRGARLKLNLTSESAKGLIAGYLDVASWYRAYNGALSTYTLSFGNQSSQSLYKAMSRLADGYPDPVTGINTALSMAQDVNLTQVFIKHAPLKISSSGAVPQTLARAR